MHAMLARRAGRALMRARHSAPQCYYMGIGDKEQGSAGGVKREISSSLTRGINAKRLCTRLKKKDAQMCELKYEKKIDVKNTDLKKLRVKELRKICDDEGIDTKGTRAAAAAAAMPPPRSSPPPPLTVPPPPAQVSWRRMSTSRR